MTKEQTEPAPDSSSPLFTGDASYAEEFKDRVRAIHEHFDKDGDGFLNYSELSALQEATSGANLSHQNYVMACQTLQCDPARGIPLAALKLTYLADGASAENDYYKVFPDERPEDYVYEIEGDDGVDIS